MGNGFHHDALNEEVEYTAEESQTIMTETVKRRTVT
jgi:hypothetical protein